MTECPEGSGWLAQALPGQHSGECCRAHTGSQYLRRGQFAKILRSGAGFGRLSAMRKAFVSQPTETYLLTLVQRQSRIVIEKRIYVCV